MCNFSNNNQSATSTNNTTLSAIELIKMAAELAAIDHASAAGLYSPIPISANFNVNIGDFNISCNIINNAARDVDCNKQATTQTTQQESKATSTTNSNQQPHEPQQDMFQLPEKYHKLYGVVTDYLGSYTKVKINITPNVTRDCFKIAFINKGVSTAATNYPFFGVESIKDQKYFEKYFRSFGVYPNGDAFYIGIDIDEEIYLNRFMQMLRENIKKNKRDVVWGRYNY